MEDLAVFTALNHSGSFGKNFVKFQKNKYVIYRLRVGPYGEKLWPRSWKCCPRPTLIFFNSLLDPVIYGWRMRQIRHAIMDTLLKVYTNRELWFWTVREILILQSTVLFRVHSNCHFGIQFFVSCFLISDSDFRCLKTSDLVLRSIPNLVQMETLSNFSFLWEVSVLFFGSVRFWKP